MYGQNRMMPPGMPPMSPDLMARIQQLKGMAPQMMGQMPPGGMPGMPGMPQGAPPYGGMPPMGMQPGMQQRTGIMPPGGQLPAPMPMGGAANPNGMGGNAGQALNPQSTTPQSLTPQSVGQIPNLGSLQNSMNDPMQRQKMMEVLNGGGGNGLLNSMFGNPQQMQSLTQQGLGLLRAGYGG